eukprot:12006006-Alexandrium_andersonii.AAC.1
MSASLVGSEMCIRDRTTRTSIAAARLPPGRLSRLRLRLQARPHLKVPWLCLLYTSDAADDM